MIWSPLSFGKHKGKTLPQVIFSDPDWFFWAYEEDAFVGKGNIEKEAREIYRKAKSIKVPQVRGEKTVVEYIVHQPSKKFGTMQFVPASRPKHVGSSPTFRSDVIDFSVPRQITKFDKLGGKTFVLAFKRIIFGKSKHMMTKKRCEEFFDNEDNFVPDKNAILKI